MTPGARVAAAIEILTDIADRRRPAPDALKDWGLGHRFAGSGDRAAIASLVYDALRRSSSAAFVMGEDTARAIMLGALRLGRDMATSDIALLCAGERHTPAPLSDSEAALLDAASLDGAPAPIAADFPDWLEPSFRRAFGDDLVAEVRALATRAPLDLRVNTLAIPRDAIAESLAVIGAEATPHSPLGLRIWPGKDGRGPPIHAEPDFIAGRIEIQDEGSQLAALLACARSGDLAVDLCAGGGGKTLALAAAMEGRGRIVATDSDIRRLAPIHERLARAGVANAEVRTPRPRLDALADLDGEADLVLVDAPCTGTGTWRRNPDAKWRLRPGSLATRLREQETVLDRAARLARRGGHIAYVTCSLLPEENDDAVAALIERAPEFTSLPAADIMHGAGLDQLADHIRVTRFGLQLTPLRTGTDGFYVACLQRQA